MKTLDDGNFSPVDGFIFQQLSPAVFFHLLLFTDILLPTLIVVLCCKSVYVCWSHCSSSQCPVKCSMPWDCLQAFSSHHPFFPFHRLCELFCKPTNASHLCSKVKTASQQSKRLNKLSNTCVTPDILNNAKQFYCNIEPQESTQQTRPTFSNDCNNGFLCVLVLSNTIQCHLKYTI